MDADSSEKLTLWGHEDVYLWSIKVCKIGQFPLWIEVFGIFFLVLSRATLKGDIYFRVQITFTPGGALLSQIEQVERSIADPPSWNSLCRNQPPQMLRSANISQVNCETDGLHVIYGKRCSTCFSLMGLLWRQKTCHIVQKFIRKMTSQLIITSVNIAAFLRWRTFLSRNWAADTQSHTTPQNAVQMC